MTTTIAKAPRALLLRLWAYCGERFPVGPSLVSAGLIAVSADLVAQSSRLASPLHLDRLSLLATGLVFAVLLLLRLFDEAKDFQEDSIAHPERPVQRGLVSLGELAGLARVVLVVVLVLAGLLGRPALFAFTGVLVFALAMRVEFFCGGFLRRRIVLYALVHQVIVPLLVLGVFAVRGALGEGLLPGPLLALQAGLAASLGLTFEVGRKIQAPAEELAADESYSSVLGIPRAVALLAAVALASAGFVVALVAQLHLSVLVDVVADGSALLVVAAFVRFARAPQIGAGKRLLGLAALHSLVLYSALIAGLLCDRGALVAL